MLVKLSFAVLVSALILPVFAQDGAQGPIYVPFDYEDGEPVYASRVGASAGVSTYAIIDGPRTLNVAPGPAILIQEGTAGVMVYVDQARPTATYAGDCELVSPVALCALFPYESGSPSTPTPGTGGGTPRPGNGGGIGNGGGTGNGGGVGNGGVGGNTGGNRGGTGSAATTGIPGLIVAVTTAVLGFSVGVAVLS